MRITLLVLISACLPAQQPVAPTREEVGNPRGENNVGYNILNSFELGYRWHTVDGNLGKYRSDVNYGNGLRLLGSQLRINSREGHGRFFDDISLTTQGLGNDPYQSSNLRIEKNKLYRYDSLWRLNEYFNPGLTIANGQHLFNTRRQFQDHDLTLLPQSAFKVFIGYSRNSQSGPALTTFQAFESRGDEFPLFSDVRRRRSEVRLGGELSLMGFTLNLLHGWDHFKEDNPISLFAPSPGNNTTDNTTLSAFRRTEPYSGDSPYWRAVLIRNAKRFGMNARYSSVSGRRDFLVDELATGTDRLTSARNRQVLIAGQGSRPVTNANLNLSYTPSDRLTITNHTGFSNTRMDGNGSYREINNAVANDAIVNFQFLGIRTIETLTDATYSLTSQVGVYGGYHFSTRRIRSREGQTISSFTDVFSVEQDNRLHSGLAGLRFRPLKPLTIQMNVELGRADQPFFPISEKKYHAINGRVQYKAKSVLISAQTKTFYNTNSVNLFAHSARSRQHSLDASWSARPWLSLDAGYSKIHLDTITGIAYFASSQLQNGRSLYLSNLHAGTFAARFSLVKRADLYVGYSIIKDTGDGRPSLASDIFYNAQTFPLSYQSPSARLSIRLRNRLRWNAGYQLYSYHEDFYQLTYQNYRAHTGYTSLLWSF
ncbi:MAG TPA: hypothetical protein VM120_02185 [Bryobacteraceae bacterium]|nr:hypothetical protein [Bryobacteraceae bacterium]